LYHFLFLLGFSMLQETYPCFFLLGFNMLQETYPCFFLLGFSMLQGKLQYKVVTLLIFVFASIKPFLNFFFQTCLVFCAKFLTSSLCHGCIENHNVGSTLRWHMPYFSAQTIGTWSMKAGHKKIKQKTKKMMQLCRFECEFII